MSTWINQDIPDSDIPNRKFTWDRKAGHFVDASLPTQDTKRQFIRGPLPLSWILKVAMLPGKGLHIGLAIWYLIGLKRSYTVKLSGTVLRSFNVSRDALYDGLKRLEEGGLVSVSQRPGQSPEVTVLLLADYPDPLKLGSPTVQ